MKRMFLLCLALVSVLASAQVKVCVDAKGKKTYTDYQCEKIGQQRADVIKDINITPKQCPAIIDAMRNDLNFIDQLDAAPKDLLYHSTRAMYVRQVEENRARYYRECER